MDKIKVKVTHRNGKNIVKSSNGPKFVFGDKMLSETIIASLVFQTMYINFEKMRYISDISK